MSKPIAKHADGSNCYTRNCSRRGEHFPVNIIDKTTFIAELEKLDKTIPNQSSWEMILENPNNDPNLAVLLNTDLEGETLRSHIQKWQTDMKEYGTDIDFIEYLYLQDTAKKCVILSEEGPQDSVFYVHALELAKNSTKQQFNIEYDDPENPNLQLTPIVDENGNITPNMYTLSGVTVNGEPVELAVVQGGGSFVDYLVYLQDKEETDIPLADTEPVIGIEVTKTSDKESGNTSVGQRATKFASWPYNAPTALVYETSAAGWNENRTVGNEKQTKALLMLTETISVRQEDGTYTQVQNNLKPFNNVDEILSAWSKPENTSTHKQDTYLVRRDENNIDLYCRIYQTDKYSDPGVGMVALISSSLRKAGYTGNINLEKHTYPNSTMSGNSKQVNVFVNNNVNVAGVTVEKVLRNNTENSYFRKATKPEKLGTIYSQVEAAHKGQKTIYSNHGGAERSSLITPTGERVTVAKRNGDNKIGIPDLVLTNGNKVMLLEGKKYVTSTDAINQIEGLNEFETFAKTKAGYTNHKFDKGITLYGGREGDKLHPDVLKNLYMWVREDGTIQNGKKFTEFNK